MENKYLEKVAFAGDIGKHLPKKVTGKVGLALGGIGALGAGFGYHAARHGETGSQTAKKYFGNDIGGTSAGLGLGFGALGTAGGALAGYGSRSGIGKKLAQGAIGAAGGGARAAAAGLVVGGAMGAVLGAPRAVGATVGHGVNAVAGHKKKASDNVYLEKVAANRQKAYLMSKGMDFGDSRAGGATNASISASQGSFAPSSSFNTGEKAVVQKRGFLGLGPKKTVGMADAGKTRITGDVLANQKPMAERLATSGIKSKAGAAEAGAGKGILNKALGFVKKNPLLAGGAAAVAGGVALGRMTKKDQPQYSY